MGKMRPRDDRMYRVGERYLTAADVLARAIQRAGEKLRLQQLRKRDKVELRNVPA